MLLVINMKKRSELREIIIKVIYEILAQANLNDYDNYKKSLYYNLLANSYSDFENKEKIYSLANKYLTDWTMERLNKVDQAIISLAIYELMYTDVPSVVAINEAIELSKKYSDEAVTKMINGILDKIYHEEEK